MSISPVSAMNQGPNPCLSGSDRSFKETTGELKPILTLGDDEAMKATDEVPKKPYFECSDCDLVFCSPWALSEHYNIHTIDDPKTTKNASVVMPKESQTKRREKCKVMKPPKSPMLKICKSTNEVLYPPAEEFMVPSGFEMIERDFMGLKNNNKRHVVGRKMGIAQNVNGGSVVANKVGGVNGVAVDVAVAVDVDVDLTLRL